MRSQSNEIRVCILGNSHVASLKLGWDQLKADWPNIELVFFAARSLLLQSLRLSEHSLISSNPAVTQSIAFTSGGRDKIEVLEYDAFLTYGLGLKMPLLDRRLTEAVRWQSCRDALCRSVNVSIARLLRETSEAPIFVGHNPQSACAQDKPCEYMSYEEVHGLMVGEIASKGIHLVRQPPETFTDDWNGKPELSKGSTRLDIGDCYSNQAHPEDDFTHMNAEFGAVYLQKFFELIVSTLSRNGSLIARFRSILR